MRFSLRTLIIVMLLGGLTIGLAGRLCLGVYRALQRTLEMAYESEHRQQKERLAEQVDELALERWTGSLPGPVMVQASDDQPPKSNTVELRGVVYRLAVRDDGLVLLKATAEGEVLTPRTLEFELSAEQKITALRLEPWVSTGLCAIVEVTTPSGYEYSCLTMAAPSRSAGYDHASAIIFKSPERHRILAVNGTYSGDTVVALLGVTRIEKGSYVVDRGVVTIDVCPAPPTAGSRSVFKATVHPAPLPSSPAKP